jgi:CDP-diacylglycerol--glycerol-3-phosphate 3-phosphatidyltransferase
LTLHREWAVLTVSGCVLLGGAATLEPSSLASSIPVWAFCSFLLFRLISEAESPLTFATRITMCRGALVALTSGFFARPEVAAPAYSLAAILDAVDGWVARRSWSETRLGAKLDLEVDAVGILVASGTGVALGKLPLWYVLVGLARYVFVLGIVLRERRGEGVRELDPSSLRRILAGGQMAFLAVSLWPFVSSSSTLPLSYAFGAATLLMFARDWRYVSSR